jgi:hypothetical protein
LSVALRFLDGVERVRCASGSVADGCAAKGKERNMKRIGTAAVLAMLGGFVASGVLAEESGMPLRSYTRFALDPAVANGLWGEVGSIYETEDVDDEDLDVQTTFARAAYGHGMWEAGVMLPYHDIDLEEDDHGQKMKLEEAGFGDLEAYGKFLPLHTELFTAGVGCVLSFPTGNEDEYLGTGEVGFLPFGTGAVRLGPAELGAHIGYQYYSDSGQEDPLHGLVYGGGVRVPFADMVAVGVDILGETLDARGSNPDIVVAEPALDLRVPVGEVGLWLRLAGVAGLNNDSPDWGIGGSVAVDWPPR